LSEFKGRITVAVSIAIVGTLALAAGVVAIFSPSTFQSNTSLLSSGSTTQSPSQGQTTSYQNSATSSVSSSQPPKTSSSSYPVGSSTTTSSFSESAAAGVTSIMIPLGAGANPSEPGGFSNPIFVPSQVTVVVGVNNTIVVTNEDNEFQWFVFTSLPAGASTPHLVDTPQLAPGQNFTFTLTIPRVYNFEDAWRPVWPRGSITVMGTSQQSNSISIDDPLST
jgi:hypothetical protein